MTRLETRYPAIVLQCKQTLFEPQTQVLSRLLDLPIVTDSELTSTHHYVLYFTSAGLGIKSVNRIAETVFVVNLDSPQYQLGKRAALSRAVGRAKTLIDATAGFGRDSVRLSSLGIEVTAIERHLVVHTMLADALSRLKNLQIKLKLTQSDSIHTLQAFSADVVYLDPMYPGGRKSSARVRKDLHILRDLCGDDEDAATLFYEARRAASKRVVVKRPHFAPPIAEKPSHSIQSKLVRYDVYVLHKES